MLRRSLLAVAVGFAVLSAACSASVGSIEEIDAASSEAVAEPTAPDATSVPTETLDAGECGPAAVPDGASVEWEVPDARPTLSQIEDLAASEPSTSFDVADFVVALNATDPSTKFVLGPAWPTEIKRVEPTPTSFGECMLTLVLTSRGLDLFNNVASTCFDRSDQCPFGQLAIVADGQVIVSPIVNSPVFEQPSLVVSQPDGMSPEQAQVIAQAIASAVQFRPVLVTVPT